MSVIHTCEACGMLERGVFCLHSADVILEAEEAIERGSTSNDKPFELQSIDQAIFVVQTWEGTS